MKKVQFTAAEKKYISLIGETLCIEAFHLAERGNGANTVGEEYLYKKVPPSLYTKAGDCIINAGRKLYSN